MKNKQNRKSEDVLKADDLKRSLKIDFVRAEDEDDRTLEIAFSSEAEVERWFGIEILDHSPQSAKLDRLNNGGAVLVNHDTRDQVGVVMEARIDADRVGRAKIRFSKSQRGEEIYQDVLDGIRQLVSFGYRIRKYETTEEKGKPDVIRATEWEPFEVSIVPIPADVSVGAGRSGEPEPNLPLPKEVRTMDAENVVEETVSVETESSRSQDQSVDVRSVQSKAITGERARQYEIRKISDDLKLDELGRKAIDEGTSVAEFNKLALAEVGKRNNEIRAESDHDGDIDLTRKDKERFSFVRLMDAVSNPNDRGAQKRAAHEIEISQAAVADFGEEFKERGIYIPPSALARDLSAGTATDGAELVATNLLSGSFIETLRNAMRTAQAGARMLPGLVGDVAIPRQVSGAAGTWIDGEDSDATEGEAQFDQVTLSPKDVACYTEVTRRLMLQSTPAIEGIVRGDLATAIALAIDLAVLYGTGANGQPTGITGQTGVNTLDLAAADPTYAELVSMIKLVMADNALMGSPSWMIDPEGWEALSTTPKQGSGVEGNFILGENGKIKGYDHHITNQMTAEQYIFGDFSQVLIGEWGGLELNVDPYTHSLKGKTRFVIFKTCDVAVRHPGAFAYAHDGIV